MRIHFKMEGGIAFFPGLSKPLIIESNQLSKDEDRELRRLIDAARFFDQPGIINTPPPGARDYYRYTITVEEAGKRHTIEMVDPIEDPDLARLVTFLKAKMREVRRKGG